MKTNDLPHNTDWRDIARAHKSDHPAFAYMREQSRRLKLPSHFGADVDQHDRASLQARAYDRPFAWIVYQHGSYIAWDSVFLRTMVDTLGQGGSAGRSQLFCWNGTTLQTCTAAEASEVLDAWNDQQSAVQWRRGARP